MTFTTFNTILLPKTLTNLTVLREVAFDAFNHFNERRVLRVVSYEHRGKTWYRAMEGIHPYSGGINRQYAFSQFLELKRKYTKMYGDPI